MQADNRFLRKTIEKALRDLPPMPTVVGKVLAETEKPEVNAQEVERLIATDQALAIKVLRVVNSAYYGLSRQISSLNQAIVILGVQQIRNLVLSVGAMATIQPKTPEEHENLRKFWKHSFGAASVAQYLGKMKKLPLKDTEVAFVASLLHDIGRLFLYIHFGDTYSELTQYAIENEVSLEQAELEFLGMTHGEVGGEMTRAWKLPDQLVTLIERHESSYDAELDSETHFIVQIADYLCKHIYYGEGPTPACELDAAAWDWLGMDDDEIAELRQTVEERIEEASALLGLMAA